MSNPSRDTSPLSPSPPPPTRPSRARPKPNPRSSRPPPPSTQSRSSTTSRGTSTRPSRASNANGATASPKPPLAPAYDSSADEADQPDGDRPELDGDGDAEMDEGSVAGPSGSRAVSYSPELMAPIEVAAAAAAAAGGVLASLVAVAVASEDGPVGRRPGGPERSSSLSDMASSRSPSPELARRSANGKGKRPAVEDDEEEDDEAEVDGVVNGLAPAALIGTGNVSEAVDSESDLSDAESVVSLSSVASAASAHTVTQSTQPATAKSSRSRKPAPRTKQGRAAKAAGRPRGSVKRGTAEPSLTPVRATRATVTMPAGYIEGVTTTRMPRAGQGGGGRVKSETPMVIDGEEEEGEEDEAEDDSMLGAVKVGGEEVEVDEEPIASQATTAVTISRAATPERVGGYESVVDTPSGAATPLDRRSPSPSLSKSTSVSSGAAGVTKPNVVVTEVDEDGDAVRVEVKEEEGSVEPEMVSPRKKAAKARAKAGLPAEPERELCKLPSWV